MARPELGSTGRVPQDTAFRVTAMNAGSSIRELDRIRSAVGSALRTEYTAVEPVPESLIALLNDLATRVRDAELDRLFADVEACVAALLHATGRQTSGARGSQGKS